MIPRAHVAHSMSRRLRIKVPSKKGDVSYFSAAEEQLCACPGVLQVRASPHTGSLLILYDCDPGTIEQYAKEKHLFAMARTPGHRPRKTLFGHVAATFSGYNRSLKKATDGQMDISSLVFLSLVASGIYQIAKGNLSAPAWYTAFYYALGIFTRAQIEEWDEAEEFPEEFDDGGGDSD